MNVRKHFALLLIVACSGTEPRGPGADAALVIDGNGGPLEVENSRGLVAAWRDSRGAYQATGVHWRSTDAGVATVDQGGVVTGVSPGNVTVTAEAGGRSASVAVEIQPLTHYSQRELSVFNELVFGGNSMRRLRKWSDNVRVEVSGDPTSGDRAVVDSVVAELSARLGTISVTVVEAGGNVQLRFVSDTLFRVMAGGVCAPPANVWGFSCPTADTAQQYVQTLVFVSSTRNADIRRYLIRHELMHMIGFYGHPSGVASVLARPEQVTLDHYLPLDLTLMEMIGRPELAVGARGDEAMAALAGLIRRGAS